MHVTACLVEQKVDVEVGEACRTIQALKEAVVVALPQLRVEGFDVTVGGRALEDEGVVSLEESVRLDVVPNTRGLSVLALREAGREVSEAGLLRAAERGDMSLCTLYVDAGVPIDCRDGGGDTPLSLACDWGHFSVVTLLLDRGSRAIDEKDEGGSTPLLRSCVHGCVAMVTLLLDRGSRAIDEKDCDDSTPLLLSCRYGHVSVATLLLDRGSRAIDEDGEEGAPIYSACFAGHLEIASLLLDRGAHFDAEQYKSTAYPPKILGLLSERGYGVLHNA